MSGMGNMMGGYPLASLFGQGQMGPIQPQMPPQGGGASPFMQGGTPQGASPFMQSTSPVGQSAQPGIAPPPPSGGLSPLAKQMMMMKMMQGQGGPGAGAGSPAGAISSAITPAMNMMMMQKLGIQ